MRMERRTEYAIAGVTTKKVFPRRFRSKEEAEKFISERPDPSHWIVMKRTVIYEEWEEA